MSRIEIKEGMEIELHNIKIQFPVKNAHPVETYGTIYEFKSKRLGYIPDTEYFPELADAYRGVDFLILNVVRMKTNKRFRHLNIDDLTPAPGKAHFKKNRRESYCGA